MSTPVVRTELDFLAECLIRLRDMRPASLRFIHTNPGQRNPFAMAEHAFQQDIVDYFQLPNFANSWVFFDEILRLYETPAGTMQEGDHE